MSREIGKHYTAYGLSIRSEIALPLAPAAADSGDAEVSIRMGAVPETLGAAGTSHRSWQAAPGRFLLAVEGVGRYLVRDGREITVEPAREGSKAAIPFLLGSVLAACLKQRGILTLHASAIVTAAGAVLFAGHSGRGKSTLAAALVERGYAMLCDDVTGIVPDEANGLAALPAYPCLRLWGDSVEALGWNGRTRGRVREGMEKFLAPVERFGNATLPVRSVFVLRYHGGESVEIEPVCPDLAFKHLLRRVYRKRFAHGLGKGAEQFLSLAELARRAPVASILKPSEALRPGAVEALATRVEDYLHDEARGARRPAGRKALASKPEGEAQGARRSANRRASAPKPEGETQGAPIVWLASYPKSGNTWLRTLLTNYLDGGEEPASINELVGRPELILREEFDERIGLPSADLDPEQILHYRSLLHEQMGAQLPRPSFHKIHDACLRTREGALLFPPVATHGAVYLVRNPLDVAVSLANHWNWPMARAVAELCRPEAALSQHPRGIHYVLPQPLLTWSGHVESWLEQGELRVHVARYEDLLSDPKAVFGAILRFVGLESDSGGVARAVEHSRFERLRAQEERSGFDEKPRTCGSFFRAGRAGSWRDALSPEQVRKLTGAHAGVMERFGYLREAEAFLAGPPAD